MIQPVIPIPTHYTNWLEWANALTLQLRVPVVEGPLYLPTFTVATQPSPNPAGGLIMVLDAPDGPALFYSDGLAWIEIIAGPNVPRLVPFGFIEFFAPFMVSIPPTLALVLNGSSPYSFALNSMNVRMDTGVATVTTYIDGVEVPGLSNINVTDTLTEHAALGSGNIVGVGSRWTLFIDGTVTAQPDVNLEIIFKGVRT